MYEYVCICVYTSMCVCVSICVYEYMCTSMYVYECVRVSMCVYEYDWSTPDTNNILTKLKLKVVIANYKDSFIAGFGLCPLNIFHMILFMQQKMFNLK